MSDPRLGRERTVDEVAMQLAAAYEHAEYIVAPLNWHSMSDGVKDDWREVARMAIQMLSPWKVTS
jgi:hypothetical protein